MRVFGLRRLLGLGLEGLMAIRDENCLTERFIDLLLEFGDGRKS